MVRKNLFKKLGVLAVIGMLTAAPILGVNAAASGSTATGNNTVASGNNTQASGNNTQEPSKDDQEDDNKGQDSSDDQGNTGNNDSTGGSTSSAAQADDDAEEATENFTVFTATGDPVPSTVAGSYTVTSVPGVAFTTPKAELPSDLTVEVANSTRGPLAAQCVENGVAMLTASGIDVTKGPEIDILAKLGDINTSDISQKLTVSIGLPKDFMQNGYDYALILVRPGGRVSVLVDKKTNPSCITVETSGFGVYALVKAPAGSFDSYK